MTSLTKQYIITTAVKLRGVIVPSNKPKVVSYLEEVEKSAFDKLCDENDFSNSEGVAHLIRTQLLEKEKSTAIDTEKLKILVNSIMPLEQIEKSSVQTSRLCQKVSSWNFSFSSLSSSKLSFTSITSEDMVDTVSKASST